MRNFLNNKNILITGGTGSFGKYLTQKLLKSYKPKKIVIFSTVINYIKKFIVRDPIPNQKY